MKNFPLLIALALFSPSAFAEATKIAVDPGHVPSAPGCIGSCGTREVDLNDDRGRDLQQALQANYQVIMTRPYHGEVNNVDLTPTPLLPPSYVAGVEPTESLIRRPQIANANGAQLYVSVHHDSAADQYHIHDPAICGGKGGERLTDAFKAAQKIGYNVWVYQGDATNNARYQASLKLAEMVGKRMEAAGFIASDYHAKPVMPCDSCHAIDQTTGVWVQDLAVLRLTTMPAILVEAINIDDPPLEQRALTPEFRSAVVAAIKGGIDEYLGTPAK